MEELLEREGLVSICLVWMLGLRGTGWMEKRLRGGVEGEDTYIRYSSNRVWRIVVALVVSAPSPLASHNAVRLTNA